MEWEERTPDKPLHKMTLPELQEEVKFREAMRYRYDGDSTKMHQALQHSLDEVKKYLKARLKSLKLPKNN